MTWKGPCGDQHVALHAEPDKGAISLSVRLTPDPQTEFIHLAVSDTNLNRLVKRIG